MIYRSCFWLCCCDVTVVPDLISYSDVCAVIMTVIRNGKNDIKIGPMVNNIYFKRSWTCLEFSLFSFVQSVSIKTVNSEEGKQIN